MAIRLPGWELESCGSVTMRRFSQTECNVTAIEVYSLGFRKAPYFDKVRRRSGKNIEH